MRQARQALGSHFYYDLFTHWREYGPEAIQKVYETDPATYLRCVVAVLPKQLDVTVTQYEGLSVDELRSELVNLQTAAREFDARPAAPAANGADPTPETAERETIEGSAEEIQTLSETN